MACCVILIHRVIIVWNSCCFGSISCVTRDRHIQMCITNIQRVGNYEHITSLEKRLFKSKYSLQSLLTVNQKSYLYHTWICFKKADDHSVTCSIIQQSTVFDVACTVSEQSDRYSSTKADCHICVIALTVFHRTTHSKIHCIHCIILEVLVSDC